MENRNLYKMDDFLIIISYLMIIPLLILAWPWLSTITSYKKLSDFFQVAPQILGTRLSAIILYGTSAICSQIIGRIIRFKEKQSLEILDTLNLYKKTTISQLSTQLDMSVSKISSLVKKMSRISSLDITVEGDMVTIGQSPLSSTQNNYQSVPTPETVDTHSPFEEIIEKVKTKSDLKDIHNQAELKKAAQNIFSTGSRTTVQGKKFNIILFIILFISPLWPIALIYAIRFAMKQQKASLEETKL